MKRAAICLAALCLMYGAAAAQTQSPNSQSSPSPSSTNPSQPKPKPKPKKVYTEDDLSQMSGGISVAVEATKAPAKKKPAEAGKNPEKANPEEAADEEEDASVISNRLQPRRVQLPVAVNA